MMNGAAEKTVLTQALPGQRGARQAPDTRMGPDQLMADFEGLLARHSMVQDPSPEQAEAKTTDNHLEQPPRATPEALFLALAGGAEFAVPEQDGDDDCATAEAEEKPSQSATPRAETPAMVIGAPTPPQVHAQTGEAKSVVEDETAPKLKAVAADAAPLSIEYSGDDLPVNLARAGQDDGSSSPPADSPVVAEKRIAKVTEELPAVEKSSKSQDGAPPVTLIRVAGQETHFAPSPVLLFDDQKIGSLPLGAPAETDAPGRSQPVVPPVLVKAPSGPLKTLKVELGSLELGMVNATVALKDKALDLRIGAARDDAVASLRENAGRLTDALQALGYSVDAVSVQKMQQSDAGAQTGSGQPQQQDAGGQDARGQGQQRPSSGSGFGSDGSSGQSRYSHRDDHLAEQEGNDHAKSTAGSRNSRGVFL
jgi:hypothetical protein